MPDSQNTVSSSTEPAPVGGQGFPQENRDGSPALIGKDDFTKQYEIGRLTRGRTEVLAGNYADLQRLGGQIAAGTVNVQAAIGIPAGIDPKDSTVLTPAQADAAKGEYNVETARTGLVAAPPVPVPRENKDPESIDPTSVSPTTAKAK